MTVATGVNLVRPGSIEEVDGRAGTVLIAGGTEVVPQLRDGLLEAETLVDISDIVPRGIAGRVSSNAVIGAGTTLAEIEASPDVPDALREAARLASSPQLRNMGTIGGNLLQSTRCLYWRLAYPCRLRGGEECHVQSGEQRESGIFANDFCASAHPSDLAAALVALGATVRTNRRELSVADLYHVPTASDRRVTTVEPGEVLLELDVPAADRSVYLKAMDRKRFSFPLVGVAAVRRGGERAVALAGIAPIPWLLDGPLDAATPLPGTAYKVQVARALVGRALGSIDGG
jgi:xanthine dehydrogenase YagS FAD-binding subunit